MKYILITQAIWTSIHANRGRLDHGADGSLLCSHSCLNQMAQLKLIMYPQHNKQRSAIGAIVIGFLTAASQGRLLEDSLRGACLAVYPQEPREQNKRLVIVTNIRSYILIVYV